MTPTDTLPSHDPNKNRDGSSSPDEANARHRRVASDLAFIARMAKAIRAGREKADIGVKVDRTPSTARLITPTPAGSCCGSPSALCMEGGEAEGDLAYV